VEGLQRRFLGCLTALAVLSAVAQGLSGMTELALYLTPLFVIAALLLCGRYVAEDSIVRRWRAAIPRRRRRTSGRWHAIVEIPLASQLERSSRVSRGPPGPAFA
jgi:hypothetical protein